jgi:EmrB/QacA subfamily drug resistance transporter
MPKSKLIPLIVACALIMQTLDATIVATALPQIAAEFGASPVSLSMCITAYLLSMAVFIPVSGWVADRFGARFVFRAAILLFTLASLLCGLSQSPEQLTAARVLQGIGGAMMVPVGRLLILRNIAKSELVSAMAWLMLPGQIGPVLGPVIGGFITSFFDWRWIFLINLPIGLVGIVLATLFIRDDAPLEKKALDWTGFVLSGLSLSSLMYAVEAIGHGATEPWFAGGIFAFGLASGWVAVLHARRRPQPLLDLPLLGIDTFRRANAGSILFRVGAGSIPFLLPLLFQGVIGMSAFQSGLLIAANPIGSLAMKIAARPVLRHFGFRTALMVNGAVCSLTIAICGWFSASTPLTLVIGLLLIGGFFQSLQYTALQTLTYADVPPASMSTATSLASMVQQLANGFGVAIGALLAQATIALSGAGALDANALRVAFAGVALFGLASVLLFAPMRRDAGAEVSGHGKAPEGAALRSGD